MAQVLRHTKVLFIGRIFQTLTAHFPGASQVSVLKTGKFGDNLRMLSQHLPVQMGLFLWSKYYSSKQYLTLFYCHAFLITVALQ
jgi:hypothetical protein